MTNKDSKAKLHRARTKASERIDHVRIEASKGINKANQLITEHPVAATAAAVAAGALAAYFFPKTARAIRKAAPKVANAAASAGREARDLALSKLPIEEAEQAIEQLADAARKANAATMDIAKAGLDNARIMAADAARRTEIETQASRMLDAASEAASRVIAKVRRSGGKPMDDQPPQSDPEQ